MWDSIIFMRNVAFVKLKGSASRLLNLCPWNRNCIRLLKIIYSHLCVLVFLETCSFSFLLCNHHWIRSVYVLSWFSFMHASIFSFVLGMIIYDDDFQTKLKGLQKLITHTIKCTILLSILQCFPDVDWVVPFENLY